MIIRQLLSLNFRGTLCSDGLVWIDLELTGLDLEKDRIMEVACVVTDKDLNAISGGLNLVLHQPDDILTKMGGLVQGASWKVGTDRGLP
ncbi:hypothetical protein MRX96_030592 [Rhipicephalus microplus]